MTALTVRQLWALAAVLLGLGCTLLVWGMRSAPPAPTPVPGQEFSLSAAQAESAAGSVSYVQIPDVELGPFVRTTPVTAPPAGGTFVSRVQIPSLYVDAEVETQGVDANNLMTLPDDLSKVGLLRPLAALGASKGSSLLAGHVNSGGQPGALYLLGQAQAGAAIDTWDEHGQHQRWVVNAVHTYNKKALPDSLFDSDGARILHLVTCGGKVVRLPNGRWTYEDNIVISAVPIE